MALGFAGLRGRGGAGSFAARRHNSQNRRMGQIGRDHSGHLVQPPLLKQGYPRVHSRQGLLNSG